MKKIYAFLAFSCLFIAGQAQQDTLTPVGWINYPSDVDWSATPYDKLNVDIMKAPSGWSFDESTFDLSQLWDSLGTANEIKNPTDAAGQVAYAAGAFGAEWKAFYDNDNLYVCMKYYDKDMLATDHTGATDSRSFEVMYQTKYADRFDPGFTAAQSIKGKNMQYARFLRLGGGKAAVTASGVTEFAASDGVHVGQWSPGAWEGNPNVLDPAPVVVWDVDAQNTVWCTVQFNFTNHMYYLNDVFADDLPENRVAFDPTAKDKISFDLKSDALIDSAATGVMKKDEFFWNSKVNDGFEATYYSGYLTFTNATWRPDIEPVVNDTLVPVGWITYPSDIDWSATPYDKMNVTIKRAPADWTFDESTFDLSSFWNSIGDAQEIKNQTDNAGQVAYDAANFGASWKAFYDDENLYVCMKYNDVDMKATDHTGATDSRAFEVMYQTKYADRFDPGWDLAQSIKGKNMQYGRFLRLGGGKAAVSANGVTAFESSDGVHVGQWSPGAWEGNPNVLDPAPVVVWDVDAQNTVWCTVQFNFTNHMYYLNNVFADDTPDNRVVFSPTTKNKISFDLKSDALIDSAATGIMKKDEFFWNSKANDGFEAVYYNGYITFGSDQITAVNTPRSNDLKVYMAGDILKIRGIEQANIEIYSTLGQLVKSARNVNELNLRELQKGIYLVRLNNFPAGYKIFKQ